MCAARAIIALVIECVCSFVAGDEILYRDEKGNLLIYNVSSATSKILLDSDNAVSFAGVTFARTAHK